jgi:hypothetical protein
VHTPITILYKVQSSLCKSPYVIPKLIDEYHWITITKRCTPPDKETLKKWIKWNS